MLLLFVELDRVSLLRRLRWPLDSPTKFTSSARVKPSPELVNTTRLTMSSFFSTWLRLVKKNPVAFNAFTGCSLCASSDALAQYLEHDKEASWAFRIRRVTSAGFVGAFFGGCVYPAAYAKLDTMWIGTNFTAVLQKSVVEIATVGIFVNSVSMSSRGLLVGRDQKDVAAHVVTEMPTVTWNDAKVWMPYNMTAFTFIPAAIRPTTTLMMEAGWQTYISIMSNNYNNN